MGRRCVGIIDGDAVYVCCLYGLHVDYERELCRHRRSEFLSCLAEFTEWLPAADADAGGDAPDAKLSADNERLRLQLDDCRAQITALKTERERLRQQVLGSRGKSMGRRSTRLIPVAARLADSAPPEVGASPGKETSSEAFAVVEPGSSSAESLLPTRGTAVTCVVTEAAVRPSGATTWRVQVEGAGPETRGVLDANRGLPPDCAVGNVYRCRVLASLLGNMAYRWTDADAELDLGQGSARRPGRAKPS